MLTEEGVIRGINVIVYGEEFKKFHSTKVIEFSFKIRKLLIDYIDCIILSSAIVNCKVLITEDEDVLMLRESDGFMKLLKDANPEFRILSLKEFFEELKHE